MRLTDRQIDTMERVELIDALQSAQNTIRQMTDYRNSLAAAEQSIADIQNQAAKMMLSLSKGALIGGGIAGFILGIILGRFITGLIIGAVVVIGLLFLDKLVLAPKREEKAKAFINENYPPAVARKNEITQAFDEFCASDEVYNTSLLVPGDYSNLEAISAILSLLQNRRARSLSEAINTYETTLHQQRVESISHEQLAVSVEGVIAQQRTANATEDTAISSRTIARNTRDIARNTRDIASNTRNIAVNTRDIAITNQGIANNTRSIAASQKAQELSAAAMAASAKEIANNTANINVEVNIE